MAIQLIQITVASTVVSQKKVAFHRMDKILRG